MKTLLDYTLVRFVGGAFQGLVVGIYLPLASASMFAEKAGRGWALVVLTIPLAIVYSIAMTLAKGPYLQYPPDKRVTFVHRD